MAGHQGTGDIACGKKHFYEGPRGVGGTYDKKHFFEGAKGQEAHRGCMRLVVGLQGHT